ncbi:hypothetical protein A6F56_04335 [Prescottella equi]|uniref:hypothetical protein n=1 Tax=Rhodococcus hoagii TaxID=43767 RepID=UPI000A0FCC68|nr:hypothetical protein [Prescottella equi]ORL01554.1 hypothetical protein A6F56_04335 [Prescottella equi]
MPDQFFITRADMQALVAKLREIPELVANLDITLTRQSRTSAGGMRTTNGTDDQPLPYDLGASDAAHHLYGVLRDWAEYVATEHGIAPPPPGRAPHYARWLTEHVTHLAMTEAAPDALPGITKTMERTEKAIDIPEEPPPLPINKAKLTQAESLELNARSCVAIAKRLGRWHEGLTQRRIKYLTETKVLKPLRTVRGIDGARHRIYRLGDVLDATRNDDTDTFDESA